ncbi:MAG: restriction endonuclease subunit S [Ginsengibacter sp.]
MREGWEIKKLGEVCIVERGSSPRPINKYFTDKDDGVNWIKIGDTKDVTKYLYSTKEKITKEGAKQSRFVKEGDFILSNSMSFGHPFIMKTEGYIHDGWFVLRLPDYIDVDYFYYLLTSPSIQEQIQGLASGAIVKNISGDLVKKVELTYPKSLHKQKHIVSILDETFATIGQAKANTEKNLNNAKELFQSQLNNIFSQKGEGWVEKKLGEVCQLKPQKKEARDKLKENDLVTFLPMEDLGVEGKEINPTKEKTLKEVSGSYTYFADGDVLLAKITPCFENGKIGIANNLKNGIGFGSSEYIVFRSNGEVEQELLYYFLSRKSFREEGRALMTGAVGHKRVSKDWIENYLLPFPKSIKEQQKIISQLNTLSTETKKLETIYQQKLNELEALKKSILQKAFSGELSEPLINLIK